MSWAKQNIIHIQIQMNKLERKMLSLDFINVKKEAIRARSRLSMHL